MRVFLVPGHGGHDPGAIGPTGLREADVALQVAGILAPMLAPLSVKVSRDACTYISPDAQRRDADAWGADLVVAIHCNAAANPSAQGVEVFTWPGQSESDILADWMLAKLGRMRSKLGPARKDMADGDGDKEARFAVLGTRCPAVLVEMGFVSHPATEEQFRKPEVLHEIAFNICDAITCWRLTGKGPKA